MISLRHATDETLFLAVRAAAGVWVPRATL